MARNWFPAAAMLAAFGMVSQACASGVNAMILALSAAVQGERPPFTDSPHPAYLGRHPGRDVTYRGRHFNDRTIAAAERASLNWHSGGDGNLFAWANAIETLVTGPVGGGGGGLPGEGSSGGRNGPLGGVVNTHNGNYMKDVQLFEFPCRGGRLAVDFTLYHNSIGDNDSEFGNSWSCSYDAVLTVESGQIGGSEIATIRWGDGTVASFEDAEGDGTFTRPAGVFDNLVKLANGNYQVATDDAVTIVFAKPDPTALFFVMSTITDRNSNTITVGTNSAGQITSVTDPTGRQVIVTYNGARVNTVTDPGGHVWTFHFDAMWNEDLVQIDYPSLGGQTYSAYFDYDGYHNILHYTDLDGYVWELQYDGDKVRKIIEPAPDFRTTEYIYGSAYTDIKNSDGTTCRHNYGRDEMLVSEVDEAGYSLNYQARNADQLPTTIQDRRGLTWARTYDGAGNLLTSKNPYLKTWTYTYTSLNDIDTVENPYGETWNYDYDGSGNLEYVYDPSNPPKRLVYNHYDSYGQIDWTKDAYDNKTDFDYDSNGNLDSIIDATLKETTAHYDALGRIDWVKDPLLHQSVLHYDEWGRMVWLEHPAVSGVVESLHYGYDHRGNVTSATDERDKTAYMVYDEAGRLTSETNAENEVETYQYNARGLLWKVTNGRNYTRTYTYNVRGETYNLAMPDSVGEGWGYDGNGNPTYHDYHQIFIESTTATFDSVNRMTQRAGVAGQSISYGYDDADRQTSMSDVTGNTTWEYWPDSQLKRIVTPQGAMRYSYDNAGRMQTLTEEGTVPEIVTTYTFDADGRIDHVVKDGKTTQVTYDDASRPYQLTYPNGSYARYTYDERDRTKLIEHKTSAGALLDKEENIFDAASNVLSRTTGGVTTTYGYDNVNRLLSESDTAGYSAVYTYDDNGNRQTSTIGGVLKTYSYDSGDKLTSVTWLGGSRTFTYDVAGRTKTSTVSGVGTTTYTWNAYNRLTSLSGPGGTEAFAYNGEDSRVSRTAGGVATSFKRAGAGQTSPVLAEIQGGATSVRYMPGVYEDRGGAVTNYHSGIKNAFLQTNAAGSQTAAKRYDAFGNVLASSGTWQGRFAYGGPHGYQTDASLQLLGDRYYDPSLGRFLTRDIAKDGRNWYTYCGNNPLAFTDPTGHMPEWFWDLVGVIDPFGVVDVIHGSILIAKGHWVDGVFTLMGIVPLAGDALKFFKYGRKAGKLGGRLLHQVEEEEGETLYRWGAHKLRLKRMTEEAEAAKRGLGHHGLSVNTAKRGKPARSAARKDVEEHFPVVQTGGDPGHHTVVLPEPITPDIVRRWNDLFK